MKSEKIRDWEKCENSPQKEKKTMKFGGEESHTLGVDLFQSSSLRNAPT